MSVLKMCAIRDNAVEAFNAPIAVAHIGIALRGFEDEVKNEESQVNKHAADFELWHLGEMDTETGVFTGTPVRLARALDYVKE